MTDYPEAVQQARDEFEAAVEAICRASTPLAAAEVEAADAAFSRLVAAIAQPARTVLEGLLADVEKTRTWRTTKGMKPASDTSPFAFVVPTGLREIEWAVKNALSALPVATEEGTE